VVADTISLFHASVTTGSHVYYQWKFIDENGGVGRSSMDDDHYRIGWNFTQVSISFSSHYSNVFVNVSPKRCLSCPGRNNVHNVRTSRKPGQ